jgi:transposase
MSTEELNKLLKQQLEFTNKQLEISQQQNKELLFKIDKIQAQLNTLLRQLYGRKSEKSPKPDDKSKNNKNNDKNDKTGSGSADSASNKNNTQKSDPQKAKRKKPPEHLFRETIHHDLPADQKFCPTCNKTKSLVGTETSEQLEFIPAKLFVKEHVKYTYSCHCCIATVPIPEQPIPGGLAGPGLLADIIISKYDDSMPLYRQNQRFKRQDNVDIPESTLCDWVAKTAFWLEPIVNVMKHDSKSSIKLHSDDTTVPVLAKGKTKLGRLWVYLSDGAGCDGVAPVVINDNDNTEQTSSVNTNKCTVYEYTPTRAAIWPLNFLSGFSGFLQADAYSGYNEAITKESITEVACMAHARRYFFDVAKAAKGESIAHDALNQIAELYHIEQSCNNMSAFQRYCYRKKHSKPILKKLYRWLKLTIKTLMPNTPISKAVNYMLNHWRALCNFLSNGYLDIDNNKAERAMRRVAIGRKNWLFAGSDEGGKRAAIIYSILETCKQNGINTFDYLKDVLTKLPSAKQSEIKNFTPYNWQPA